MKRISPCLWFDNQADEAAKFYVSIFKNSKVGKIAHYDAASSKASGQPEGSVMTVAFELDGTEFLGLNGGPQFKFSEATSFIIYCESQREVDDFWEKLSKGGQPLGCGWVKDRFGLCWQVTPTVLPQLLTDKDSAKASRVMQAMLQMTKIDIEKLQEAAKGKK